MAAIYFNIQYVLAIVGILDYFTALACCTGYLRQDETIMCLIEELVPR